MSNGKDIQRLSRFGIVLTIPAALVAGPLIGYVAGQQIDQRWQTTPRVAIGGAIIGFLASCIQVFRILVWISKVDRDKTKRS